MFRHQCSYILEHPGSETSLNKAGVVISAAGLNNTQVINKSVAVQIQVIDHVATGVQEHLKLADTAALSKSSRHSVQIQIETGIGTVVRYLDGSYGSRFRRRRSDGG